MASGWNDFLLVQFITQEFPYQYVRKNCKPFEVCTEEIPHKILEKYYKIKHDIYDKYHVQNLRFNLPESSWEE